MQTPFSRKQLELLAEVKRLEKKEPKRRAR